MNKVSRVQLGKALIGQQDGSTAIEFAMLAGPFILIVVGIIELSLMFTSAALLESATATAARQIRTGELARLAGTPEQQEQLFRDTLCARTGVLIPCGDITFESVNIGSFGGYGGFEPSFDEDGNLESQGFDVGGVSQVMLIRTFFRYEFSTPLIGNLLGEGGSGTRRFMSTIVLQTEPYEFLG